MTAAGLSWLSQQVASTSASSNAETFQREAESSSLIPPENTAVTCNRQSVLRKWCRYNGNLVAYPVPVRVSVRGRVIGHEWARLLLGVSGCNWLKTTNGRAVLVEGVAELALTVKELILTGNSSSGAE